MSILKYVKMDRESYNKLAEGNAKLEEKLRGIISTPKDTSDDEPRTEQRPGTEARK
jgi:hypothetical protein